MAAEKQRITADLEELFPGDTLTIGSQTLIIRPLGAGQIATTILSLKSLVKTLNEEGVTWDNYNEPENLLKLASITMNEAPDLLAEVSNIHVDDLKRLPLEVVVEIIDKVLEVNMKAKDSLMGNFNRLMGRFKVKDQMKELQKQSKN